MEKSINLSALVAELLSRVVYDFELSPPRELSCEASIIQSLFTSYKAPIISLHEYFIRMSTYMNCSPSCFIIGFIYIDKLMQNQPEFVPNKYNIHR